MTHIHITHTHESSVCWKSITGQCSIRHLGDGDDGEAGGGGDHGDGDHGDDAHGVGVHGDDDDHGSNVPFRCVQRWPHAGGGQQLHDDHEQLPAERQQKIIKELIIIIKIMTN